jgi:hypothetical protein
MSAFFVAAACFAAAGEQPPASPNPADGVRPFAEGIRIDWPNLAVELDAQVVLREGPLELFACSPKTKEHESILSVSAKPMRIYQALGLIGLNPGRPLRFDEKNSRWEEPQGDRLELRVRYTDERGTHVVASEQWVRDAKNPNPSPPGSLNWVFAGSGNLPDGRFAADLEGTIACLVDFESALIALGSRHSADNEELWLVANAKEIPPRGTKCTLLIRSDHRPTVEVELVDEHAVRYKDQSLSAEELAKMLRPPPDDARPGRLYIHPAANVSDEAAKAFVERVIKSGFAGVIETKGFPGPNAPPLDTRTGDPR